MSLGLSAWTVVVSPFTDAFAVFPLRVLSVGAGELAFLDWGAPDLAFLRGSPTVITKVDSKLRSLESPVCFRLGGWVRLGINMVSVKNCGLAVFTPMEAAPGRVARYDTEYQRNGTRNLFMICEPKGGWRHVEVTERRTAVDFAHQMRWLVDEAYPDAEVVRLVLDNLNTHQLGSLYEAFEPCEARRIAQRLEFHYTPTHGSWLNMAEIELSVFSRGCLNRRISDEAELRREVAALERERNAAKSAIDWRFTPKMLAVSSNISIRQDQIETVLGRDHGMGGCVWTGLFRRLLSLFGVPDHSSPDRFPP